MAKLEFRGETITDHEAISCLLTEHGVPFEQWPLRGTAKRDDEVLDLYHEDVERLKRERGYVAVDMVALRKDTPNLSAISAKFAREHHHIDDEVRFTVEGEGVFEIASRSGEFLKFTAEPGDLIIIPANRRHLFYLTSKQEIRCIRLFLTPDGWEALY
jgi:1,2-dihydroxy-3-keto-5-methylthiopentene dioxygenase